MKQAWTVLSSELEKQKKLTDTLIMSMTHERYKNKLSRIRTPETMATALSFILALLILVNFSKYNTIFLAASALFAAAYLIVMPVLSLRLIRHLENLDITGNHYKQVLTDYALRKRKLLSFQKLNVYLGFVLLVVTLPVMVRIMGRETPIPAQVWYWYLPLGGVCFAAFARGVYRYYAGVAHQAENLLKELQE